MIVPHRIELKDWSSAEIREARADDAEAPLAHVNAVGAEEVFLGTEHVDRSVEEQRRWISAYDGASSLLLVAVRDRELVGSADFKRGRERKSAHVVGLGIAIRAPTRGLGLGRALMADGIEWSREIGARKLSLSVFASNERAIVLYRTLGFEEEGRLRGQVVLRGVDTDLVYMAKWLPPIGETSGPDKV